MLDLPEKSQKSWGTRLSNRFLRESISLPTGRTRLNRDQSSEYLAANGVEAHHMNPLMRECFLRL
jgi:hypothetical protein